MNTTNETVSGARLAIWATRAKRINSLVQSARLLAETGRGNVDDTLFEAQELSEEHRRELAGAAGIHAPATGYKGDPVPLEMLDTPNSRELLALLKQAVQVAERVDAERGRALPAEVPTMPGESRGTDLSETLASLVLRLWQEVEGPAGRE